VAITLWLLYRYYRHDELFFVCTSSGVLLTALFALSSLGQIAVTEDTEDHDQ
ncbi:hypothetical protein GV789_28885, partial [Nocardia cyriacigeorgica]|nr:hypothetical protein [Nocardia cyriacigeorgica]